MSNPSRSSGLLERFANRGSDLLKGKANRRSFLTRLALVGSAVAVNPLTYLLKPISAYGAVCGTCSDGWTAFCCTVNGGKNSCPPGSFVAGWWKADDSAYCGGGPRYIVDCNATCPTQCDCRCSGASCDGRRTCCNQFRYGQCNQQISCAGPVVCRVALCITPWSYDSACSTHTLTDNRTAGHGADCLYHEPDSPITHKYYDLGGPDGFLGVVTSPESGASGGRWAGYRGGRIYYSTATGPHEIHGSILTYWRNLGSENSVYKYPTADVGKANSAGRSYGMFTGGEIHSSSALGTHGINGAFWAAYKTAGGRTKLKDLSTEVTNVGDGRGQRQSTERATIYSTTTTGTRVVSPPILATYLTAGGPTGTWGYPIAAATTTSLGKFSQRFEGGTLEVTSPYLAFVKAVFQDFLGRQPSNTELNDQVNALINGTVSPAALVEVLSTSVEYVTVLVQRFYQDTLGRVGEPSGVSYWVEQLRRKKLSVARTAGFFYSSDEYFHNFGGARLDTWVDDLYLKILLRPSDPSGSDYWVGLAGTKGRWYVATHFYQSLESAGTRVTRLYNELLGRAPDASGLSYWKGIVVSSGDLKLARNLAISAEYVTRAQSRYPS